MFNENFMNKKLFTWQPSSSSSSFFGFALILFWGCFLNHGRGCGFLLFLFLDCHEQADNVLSLDHVVLINLELSKNVVNLSLGHLISPGHESVGKHLRVDLALQVISLEGLDDQVIRVVAISSHLVLEHLDHVVHSAG